MASYSCFFCGGCPEGPARHHNVSRQILSPHCLETIFDSQLPSPKLSPKMPRKLSLPTQERIFPSFKTNPVVRVIARQLRDKNCLAAIFGPRHQHVPLLAHWVCLKMSHCESWCVFVWRLGTASLNGAHCGYLTLIDAILFHKKAP